MSGEFARVSNGGAELAGKKRASVHAVVLSVARRALELISTVVRGSPTPGRITKKNIDLIVDAVCGIDPDKLWVFRSLMTEYRAAISRRREGGPLTPAEVLSDVTALLRFLERFEERKASRREGYDDRWLPLGTDWRLETSSRAARNFRYRRGPGFDGAQARFDKAVATVFPTERRETDPATEGRWSLDQCGDGTWMFEPALTRR